MGTTRFARFAWGVLLYNLLVIVWGAFVRASNSGDGCGSHWPLCDGQVLPQPENIKTMIEFSHRLMSGLDGFLILGLFIWAFRLFPRGHRVRIAALLTLTFTIIEALIGRYLVKKGLVADNASLSRAVWLAGHLVNTFLLLAWLTLTAIWSSGGHPVRLRGQGAVAGALGFAILGLILLGISGAVTALGDTLFPVRSTAEAIQGSLTPGAHFLVRLRLLHPLIALSVGLYLLLIAGLVAHLRPSPFVRRYARHVVALFCLEIAAGLLNKTLLAPVWMQLLHLLLADLLWITLIALTASALAEDVPQIELGSTHLSAGAVSPHAAVGTATWRDYLALTKPRVISLLLFTALAAMFIAQDDKTPVTWTLFLSVAMGGYMAAGAANAINMVIDRDIDARMRRTETRPTVTQRIPSRNALWFALALAFISFLILWLGANMLAAALALAGLVFYVIVYTLGLKRRTWQNIVIGGAAGAFPPLVGWSAVTGNLSVLAWFLFALIFVWTPVHFWALALLLKDDYAEAGVPMLPVVLGERVTVIQIGLYAIVTAIVSVIPFFLWQPSGELTVRQVGPIYLAGAILLNAILLLRSLQLFQQPSRPRASSLFHYSMLYLALLFLVMAVDRVMRL